MFASGKAVKILHKFHLPLNKLWAHDIRSEISEKEESTAKKMAKTKQN